MIFQNGYNWVNFAGDVIGAILATIGAILTWAIIEFFKKRKKSNKIKETYKKFYEKISKIDVTDKQKADLDKAEIIHLIVYEIGVENVSKVLKFRYRYEYGESMAHIYNLENSLWQLNIQSGIGGLNAFNIKRHDGGSYHFDERPNQDVDVRNEFLNYVKKECQKANIEFK